MEKKDSKEKLNEKNVNVYVDKKKNSIVPFLFIVIVILLLALCFVIYYKENNRNIVSDNETSSSTKEDINQNLNKEENNIEDIKDDKINNEIARIYEKIDSEYWMSKKTSDKYSIFNLNNKKIEYSNGQIIDFEYGTPKYIQTILGGGVPYLLIVLTEEDNAYKIVLNDGLDLSDVCDQSKFDIIKIELDEKIIDMTEGNGVTVPYSGPYYLTESGKLLTEDGVSYDEINRNHIKRIGSLGRAVYINEDKTLETPRVSQTNEYIDVVYENGEKIKAKVVFCESSEKWTGTTSEHFYVIDENDKLLDFSDMSLFVADYYFAHTVKDFKYSETDNSVVFYYTDGTSEKIEKVYQYVNVE